MLQFIARKEGGERRRRRGQCEHRGAEGSRGEQRE